MTDVSFQSQIFLLFTNSTMNEEGKLSVRPKRIKCMIFNINDENFWTKNQLDKMQAFLLENRTNALILQDGRVMITGQPRIRLNLGLLTLAQVLECDVNALSIVSGIQEDDLLREAFPKGDLESTSMLHWLGVSPTSYLLNKIVHAFGLQRTKARNKIVLETPTEELLERGEIAYHEVFRLEEVKQWREKRKRFSNANNDLKGKISYTFNRYVDGEIVPNTAIIVDIIGFPNQLHVKKKHYHIYSRKPGFGKSYFLDFLYKNFNADFVPDLSNFTCVRDNSHLLLFDEIAREKGRCLSFASLKNFCRGDAMPASANKKTFGESFMPRRDVQLISCSNTPLYEIYATGKNNHRWMRRSEILQLDERFFMICLDGDAAADRARYFHPQDLSSEELSSYLQLHLDEYFQEGFYSPVKIEDILTRCISAIQGICDIIKEATFPTQVDRFMIGCHLKKLNVPESMKKHGLSFETILSNVFNRSGTCIKSELKLEKVIRNISLRHTNSIPPSINNGNVKLISYSMFAEVLQKNFVKLKFKEIEEMWETFQHGDETKENFAIYGLNQLYRLALSHVLPTRDLLLFYTQTCNIDLSKAIHDRASQDRLVTECIKIHTTSIDQVDKAFYKSVIFDRLLYLMKKDEKDDFSEKQAS